MSLSKQSNLSIDVVSARNYHFQVAVSSSGLTASLLPIVDLLGSRTTCVLTGAGISTESGIPDYRGPERAGRPATPITLNEFLASAKARRRYWARSAIGWPWMESKRPNVGHGVVAALERAGICRGLITQNVDGLHRDAGSRAVVELHGALRAVVCLDCTKTESRYSLQERILVQNPGWMQHAGDVAPDGDVHLDASITMSFRVPACLHCGGTIKPDVVFFGESVPAARVERAFSMLSQAEALLVLGSSLTVYSGYRFVVAAVKQNMPVMIVNDGPTRADTQATVKVEARLGDALAYLGSTLDLV